MRVWPLSARPLHKLDVLRRLVVGLGWAASMVACASGDGTGTTAETSAGPGGGGAGVSGHGDGGTGNGGNSAGLGGVGEQAGSAGLAGSSGQSGAGTGGVSAPIACTTCVSASRTSPNPSCTSLVSACEKSADCSSLWTCVLESECLEYPADVALACLAVRCAISAYPPDALSSYLSDKTCQAICPQECVDSCWPHCAASKPGATYGGPIPDPEAKAPPVAGADPAMCAQCVDAAAQGECAGGWSACMGEQDCANLFSCARDAQCFTRPHLDTYPKGYLTRERCACTFCPQFYASLAYTEIEQCVASHCKKPCLGK
jgi:hypothetical protein